MNGPVRWWRDGWAFGLCVLAALAIGCVKDSGTSGKSAADAAAVPPKDLPSGEMPSKEEATEVARQIEAGFANASNDALRSAIDWTLVFERATVGVDAPKGFDAGFRKGLMASVDQGDGLPNQVLQLVQQGARYQLLRVREKNGEMRALFRLLMPEAGVNYHDLLMVRGKDNRVRIGDIYVFLSAEDISTTFRRFFLAFVAEQNRSLLERLGGAEAEYAAHIDDIHTMNTSVQKGRPQEALKIYQSLPPLLQADKSLLLVRYQAAVAVGTQETLQAIREFRQHYPDDPCVDFLSIDLYGVSGEVEKAVECIDRVEKSVGGDPYLNVLRAGCLSFAKRFDEAKVAAGAAIKAEPDMIQAYWALAGLHLQTQDFAEVTRLLRQIDEKFEVQFQDLTQVPDYAEYVKSPEYQKWLESRKQSATSPLETPVPH